MTTDTTMKFYHHVWQIEQDLNAQGSHWFDKASMRFFNTRLSQEVYGGRFFVTSEQFDWKSPRLYTVREVVLEDGKLFINTRGEFQQFRTKYQAVKFAKSLAAFARP